MTTLNYKLKQFSVSQNLIENVAMIIALLLTWCTLPKLLILWQPTVGLLDAGIWQLIFLSLIAFIGMVSLCWWLVYRYWQRLGLPTLNNMVSQFKTLSSWQQIGFYWASFALLFLGGLLSLAAIF